MKLLRKLLLPFSLIYWCITGLRNVLYDTGIFKSYAFKVAVIAVGNLSTGGTGKTPQTEYLIRLLADKYRVATLSRGYKRKSSGFVLGAENSNADILGDEPYQFYQKFPHIRVAVDANRKNGIEQLLALKPKPQVILLDDAYQHRRVKAGLYVLLTAYNDLYANDYLLPAGNLRESRSGAKRATAIIVTKCPTALTKTQQQNIISKLKPQQGQQVYFTSIEYDTVVYSETGQLPVAEVKTEDKVLVAGIAKPQPFFEHLKKDGDEVLTYPDHHDFTDKEIEQIETLSLGKIIVTTEKDYVRLRGRLPKERLFYLPIKSRFLNNADAFDAAIVNYVQQNSGK